MIWKGKEGYIARNGLTIFPWYLVVLKLTRRFVLSVDDSRGIVLTIDLRRDHSMYRADDLHMPTLTCRRCNIYAPFYRIANIDVDVSNVKTPNSFCSGKRYRWSSRQGSLWRTGAPRESSRE